MMIAWVSHHLGSSHVDFIQTLESVDLWLNSTDTFSAKNRTPIPTTLLPLRVSSFSPQVPSDIWQWESGVAAMLGQKLSYLLTPVKGRRDQSAN